MTIAQAAEKFDLTPDTLRYYEKIGLIPPIQRSAGGIRNYTDDDCGWISFIKCMRSAGVSVETLVEYVRLFHEGDSTITQRKQLLMDERGKIVMRIKELNDVLSRLDWKLEGYEERLLACEKGLRRKEEQS
ncbi:MAG: MerR family transcriptional regulator [Clostridia bacterium]|nr:MerR family transcriptional regulator [Clostridia bacterium]